MAALCPPGNPAASILASSASIAADGAVAGKEGQRAFVHQHMNPMQKNRAAMVAECLLPSFAHK